jgi:hypothetical protein
MAYVRIAKISATLGTPLLGDADVLEQLVTLIQGHSKVGPSSRLGPKYWNGSTDGAIIAAVIAVQITAKD